MKIRTDVAEMLRDGHSVREIARTLHVDVKTISAARSELGLPRHKPGRRPADSPQDLFRDRTEPVGAGHLKWTGEPTIRWGGRGGRRYRPARIAFVMQHNRDPIGQVRPGCNYPSCVSPSHVEDQPMRDGISGGAE